MHTSVQKMTSVSQARRSAEKYLHVAPGAERARGKSLNGGYIVPNDVIGLAIHQKGLGKSSIGAYIPGKNGSRDESLHMTARAIK